MLPLITRGTQSNLPVFRPVGLRKLWQALRHTVSDGCSYCLGPVQEPFSRISVVISSTARSAYTAEAPNFFWSALAASVAG